LASSEVPGQKIIANDHNHPKTFTVFPKNCQESGTAASDYPRRARPSPTVALAPPTATESAPGIIEIDF
jgi:hypothetical protein